MLDDKLIHRVSREQTAVLANGLLPFTTGWLQPSLRVTPELILLLPRLNGSDVLQVLVILLLRIPEPLVYLILTEVELLA